VVKHRAHHLAQALHGKFVQFLEECGTKEEFLQPRRQLKVR